MGRLKKYEKMFLGYVCQKCGHEWVAKESEPKKCASCSSRTWRVE